jgi:hypothetical protein
VRARTAQKSRNCAGAPDRCGAGHILGYPWGNLGVDKNLNPPSREVPTEPSHDGDAAPVLQAVILLLEALICCPPHGLDKVTARKVVLPFPATGDI